MALEIVWRNPLPLARIVHQVRLVSNDEFRSVYAVTDPNAKHELELTPGHAA
jgi:hypothetical protein